MLILLHTEPSEQFFCSYLYIWKENPENATSNSNILLYNQVKSEGGQTDAQHILPDQHDHAYHTNFEVRKSANF